MNKATGITLAGLTCAAMLLSSCSVTADENTAVNRAIRSALSPSVTEEASEAQITPEEALDLVIDKLDPEEAYTATVSPTSVVIEARSMYVVTIALDGSVLEPSAAVDCVSGEIYSCYSGQTLGDFAELPYLAQSARTQEWSGTFVREDDAASAQIRQSDPRSFEFVLENSASGITSKLNGTAQIEENSMPQYIGEDGLCLVFELSEDGRTLDVFVSSENTASSADSYAGTYILAE